jgi:hypothetical protein
MTGQITTLAAHAQIDDRRRAAAAHRAAAPAGIRARRIPELRLTVRRARARLAPRAA